MTPNTNQELEIMKDHLLQVAYAKHLLTPEQYEKKYKGKYIDQYGCDSFMNLLSYLIEFYGEEGFTFVTLCKPMLKDKKKFKKIFEIDILSPEDCIKKGIRGEANEKRNSKIKNV